MLDTKALAAATALIVREHVDAALAPVLAENKALRERMEALETAPIVSAKDITVEISPYFEEMLDARFSALPAPVDGKDGIDGKDADPAQIKAMIDEVVATLPAPERGEKGETGERGPEGPSGKDIDMDQVKRLVDEAVASLPPPVPGEPGPQGIKGEPGEPGRDGKDGAGIADLVIDRSGNLVATFTDGRMKEVGLIVGKDGRDGIDGKDGVPFGPDDIDMTLMEDGRTLRIAFSKGDTEYAFQVPFPAMIYRGVWREGQEYAEGDTVTWGGNLWHANKETGGKPDCGDWTLCAKKGRDGKDAR